MSSPAATTAPAATAAPYTLRELVTYFLGLGTFGFGGPIVLTSVL